MNSSTDYSGCDSGGEIAITDQANASSCRANVADQLFMAGTVEHNHSEVLHGTIHAARDVAQVLSNRRIQIDCAFARWTDNNFFHIAVGRV